eukprot:11871325-Ditylum_brightwellii.AAC.1
MKASALKNVSKYDESSLQKISSNDKQLCGVESTYFKKNQPKHKVDAVNDCSDNKKTSVDEKINCIVAKGTGVPNVPHGFQKWGFDTSKRT